MGVGLRHRIVILGGGIQRGLRGPAIREGLAVLSVR